MPANTNRTVLLAQLGKLLRLGADSAPTFTTLTADAATIDIAALNASIDTLTDVDITTVAPITGDALIWDGSSKFVPGASFSQSDFDSAFYEKFQTDFDSAFGLKTTSNLTEGSNLYYTQSRFDTAFGNKSTTNLSEGTNLYYTLARVDSDIDAKVTKSFIEAFNINADTLDTLNSTQFLRSDQSDTMSGALTVTGVVTAGGAIQVPYQVATKLPMIVLQGASSYGLFHTEATSDDFTLDFNGTSKFTFNETGNLTAAGTVEAGVFFMNGNTVSSSYTFPSNKNAMSAGPITIADGVTITIPSGSAWTIV